MKIAFIADSGQELYAFPELIESLSGELKDLQPKEFFVPTMLDIPAKCLEAQDFDIIFAMHLYKKDDENDFRLKVLAEKLVDFELAHKVKVLKAIEPSGLEDALTEDDFATAKQEFVEKWSAIILGVLFDEESFKPSPDEDSDEDGEDGENEEAEESDEDEE